MSRSLSTYLPRVTTTSGAAKAMTASRAAQAKTPSSAERAMTQSLAGNANDIIWGGDGNDLIDGGGVTTRSWRVKEQTNRRARTRFRQEPGFRRRRRRRGHTGPRPQNRGRATAQAGPLPQGLNWGERPASRAWPNEPTRAGGLIRLQPPARGFRYPAAIDANSGRPP